MKWTPGILFDFIRESPGGTVDSRKSKQMFKMAIFSLLVCPNLAQGVYRSGRTYRIWISRSLMRPCGFEMARSQKPLKNSQILSKKPKFGRFFVSRCFKTWWSHLGPKNLNSTGSSQYVDPSELPVGILIVKLLGCPVLYSKFHKMIFST